MELADPIYNFIHLTPEIKYQFLQNPNLQEEIFRAKNMACLGLVRYFFPSASHTKFEHHLGTYHLIRKSRSFLTHFSPEDFYRIHLINFYSCFGYLPLGYCASEAVILAARKEPAFRKHLLSVYLNPVLEAAQKWHTHYSVNLNFIIDGYLYKTLNSWFGAWKILQAGSQFPCTEITPAEIIFYLIDNKNPFKKAYFDYATIDYLQRDLFYTGGGKIHLPVNKIFSKNKKGIVAPDYALLIESMRSTLSNQVYCEPRHISLESLLKYELAELLLSHKVTLEEMLQIADYPLETKSGIAQKLAQFTQSRTILRDEYFINIRHASPKDQIPRNRLEAVQIVYPEKPDPDDGFILSCNIQNLRIAYNQFHVLSYIIQQTGKINFDRLLAVFHSLSDLFTHSKIESGLNLNAYLHAYARELLAFIYEEDISISYDSVFFYIQEYLLTDNRMYLQFQQNMNLWIDKIQGNPKHQHNILHTCASDLKQNLLGNKKLAFILEYIMLGPVEYNIKKTILNYLQSFIHSINPGDKQWPQMKIYFLSYLYLLKTRVIKAGKAILCPRIQIENNPSKENDNPDFILIDLKYKELHFFLGTKGKTKGQFQKACKKIQNITEKMEIIFNRPAWRVYFIGQENYPYKFNGKYQVIGLEEIMRAGITETASNSEKK